MEIKLEKRKCAAEGCNSFFTVLETSKQRYHSSDCANSDNGGVKGWKGEGNQNQREEAQKLRKGEGLKLVKDTDSRDKTLNLLSKKKKDNEITTKEPLRGKEIPLKNTITKTEKERSNKESSGLENTKKSNFKPKENIMPKTGKDLQSLSRKESIEEIQPEAYLAPKETLPMVNSVSMNLLDSTAEHLHGLMKGLTANSPDPSIKAYSPEVVDSACSCAKNIREIMKLKLDAIKLQRSTK